MNPLELRGPQFILFYLLYGIAFFLLAAYVRRRLDAGDDSFQRGGRWFPGHYPDARDATAIALLRGGRSEAVRTVLGRLKAAGFVRLNGTFLERVEPHPAGGEPAEALDRSALGQLTARHTAVEAERWLVAGLHPELEALEGDLEREGLLPSAQARQRYLLPCLAGLALLPGLGLVKLGLALARGRTNVGFLLVLIVVAAVLLVRLFRIPRPTLAGKRYLDWLRSSHAPLVEQLRSESTKGQPTGESSLAGAIFGLATVPFLADLARATDRKLFSGDGGSSCSSASSCSSCSGGSGCGGGGCGGCGS